MTNPTQFSTAQPVAGHWAGLVADLESGITALGDYLAELAGDADTAAKTKADGALGFLRSRLQDARNWLDHHGGVGTVSAPEHTVPLTQELAVPAEQAQEHPGDVEARSAGKLPAGGDQKTRR